MSTAPQPTGLSAALRAARQGTCSKTRRGAAVFDPSDGFVLGAGHNSIPDQAGSCAGTEQCRAECGRICVHAEVRAIREALCRVGTRHNYETGEFIPNTLRRYELVHVKLATGYRRRGGDYTDDLFVVSGPPSCWQCSREILDVGLEAVWLYHEGGWRRYPAPVFHALTLEAMRKDATPPAPPAPPDPGPLAKAETAYRACMAATKDFCAALDALTPAELKLYMRARWTEEDPKEPSRG